MRPNPQVPLLIVRPFQADRDYPARADILNSAFPDRPLTQDELRNWDERENRNPKFLSKRLVGELPAPTGASEGRVVSFLWYGHQPGQYHPRKLHFNLAVHPDIRRRGIGRRMYEEMLAGVAPHDPIQINTGTFANQPAGLAFLKKRGFVERMRFWESYLDVNTFDPAPFEAVVDKVREQGIEIRSEAELMGDPQFERRLYDLYLEVLADVPAPDPITSQPFERFREMRRGNINLLPEGSFVALERGDSEYVAASSLWKMHAAGFLNTGLTGVRRAYRGRGIALALKLRAIEFAKGSAVAKIKTENESFNHKMLAINERLGFRRGTAGIALSKRLADV